MRTNGGHIVIKAHAVASLGNDPMQLTVIGPALHQHDYGGHGHV